MSDAGIPLRIIQEVSGHRSLEQLQAYIEVRDEQVLGAVTALSMLSPVEADVRKYRYPDVENPTTVSTNNPNSDV
jgi:integrase/recombinase XerD